MHQPMWCQQWSTSSVQLARGFQKAIIPQLWKLQIPTPLPRMLDWTSLRSRTPKETDTKFYMLYVMARHSKLEKCLALQLEFRAAAYAWTFSLDFGWAGQEHRNPSLWTEAPTTEEFSSQSFRSLELRWGLQRHKPHSRSGGQRDMEVSWNTWLPRSSWPRRQLGSQRCSLCSCSAWRPRTDRQTLEDSLRANGYLAGIHELEAGPMRMKRQSWFTMRIHNPRSTGGTWWERLQGLPGQKKTAGGEFRRHCWEKVAEKLNSSDREIWLLSWGESREPSSGMDLDEFSHRRARTSGSCMEEFQFSLQRPWWGQQLRRSISPRSSLAWPRARREAEDYSTRIQHNIISWDQLESRPTWISGRSRTMRMQQQYYPEEDLET